METEKEINFWKAGEKKNAEEKEGKYLEHENIWSAEEKKNRIGKRKKIIGQRRKKEMKEK